MVPAVGRSSPTIIRAMVVLPEPDSPTIASDLAEGTVKLTASTATRSPNSLRSPFTSSTGRSPLPAMVGCDGPSSDIWRPALRWLGREVPAQVDRADTAG